MSEREPCGDEPVHVHCHGCGHDRVIGWTPRPLTELVDALEKAQREGCTVCDNPDLRIGPACSTAYPEARTR